MITPILWKEWREQRWKLAFGTVMLIFFTGSFFAARVSSNREVTIVIWVFGGLLLGLYSAMGVFAPERTHRTVTFLAAKPVVPWKVFFVKWLVGWLNMAVPMAACTVLALVVEHGNYPARRLAAGLAGGLGLATAFYTLTCCLSPRRAGEAMVGVCGLLVFLVALIHMFIAEPAYFRQVSQPGFDPSLALQVFVFINPIFWLVLIDHMPGMMSWGIFGVTQGAVFGLTMAIGYRNWRRSA